MVADDEGAWIGRLAEAVGRQALPLFGLALAALLLATAAAWWALRRWGNRRARTERSPVVGVALRLLGGFAVMVAGAWVFAELADELGDGAVLGPADQRLTNALAVSVPRWALHGFAAVTHLADTATLALACGAVAVALLWARRRTLALGWVGAVAGNGLLNHSLKQVFERVRPLHDDGLVLQEGYSFPSGHSSGAVVAFGMLAYLGCRLLPPRWQLPVLLAAVGLAFSVGASRVFLRVHFASDVLAGFASGLVWLAVCIASVEAAGHWRQGRSGGGNRAA